MWVTVLKQIVIMSTELFSFQLADLEESNPILQIVIKSTVFH